MTLARRVMWKEGMFLRPHHFQQQDLRSETALAARIAAAMPFHWGFDALEIDQGRLESGQFGLTACSGAFRDGTPFAAPGEAGDLPPLTIRGDAKAATVWLTTPAPGPGSPLAENRTAGRVTATRYGIQEQDVPDRLREGLETQPIELGSINLGLAVGTQPPGFDALPVARVLEVVQGRVRLDPDFIPPVLHVGASVRLVRALGEIAARFEARAANLAGPLGNAGGLSAGAVQQLMLLRLCNGKAALFAHLEQIGGRCHPEDLYRAFVEAAAELATFTNREARRAPPAPTYDHDDPALCFGPVIDVLFQGLGALDQPEASQVPLEFENRYRIHFNRTVDPSLLENARFFLLGSAAMTDDDFRRALPASASIGSTGEIMEIMSSAGRSVPIRALAHFPPELRQLGGWVCFELDQNAASWRAIREQRTIAIHTQEGLQDLKLQLWAVRN